MEHWRHAERSVRGAPRAMSLWGRKPSGDEQKPVSGEEQEPVSEIAQLSEGLYQLAGEIAREYGSGDYWTLEVRKCAAQIAAGQRAGLDSLFRLFDSNPRNPINEMRPAFAQTRRFRETMGLAAKLRGELSQEDSRSREAERGLVLVPWSDGSNGKAVVYKDGTVITTDNDAPGNPQFTDIYEASGQEGNNQVAIMAIGPDGSCDVFRVHCKEKWLATKLHAHHPRLHLVGPLPPKT